MFHTQLQETEGGILGGTEYRGTPFTLDFT